MNFAFALIPSIFVRFSPNRTSEGRKFIMNRLISCAICPSRLPEIISWFVATDVKYPLLEMLFDCQHSAQQLNWTTPITPPPQLLRTTAAVVPN